MALARCERCGQPEGRKGNVYITSHQPVSHPTSGVVCGSADCDAAALVWLLAEEEAQYKKGQRVFQLPNAGAKLRVQ
jgi:hypothetical protein